MKHKNYIEVLEESSIKKMLEQDFEETAARIACNSYKPDVISAFDPAPYFNHLSEINGVN